MQEQAVIQMPIPSLSFNTPHNFSITDALTHLRDTPHGFFTFSVLLIYACMQVHKEVRKVRPGKTDWSK